jgi:ferritin
MPGIPNTGERTTMRDKLIDPFNDQIQSEFTASAQYVAIAVYFDEMGLLELAKFFYRQAEEERMHAMKFVHFMIETEAKPIMSWLKLRCVFAMQIGSLSKPSRV